MPVMLPKPLGVGTRCCKPSSRRTRNVRGLAGRLGHEGWVGARGPCSVPAPLWLASTRCQSMGSFK